MLILIHIAYLLLFLRSAPPSDVINFMFTRKVGHKNRLDEKKPLSVEEVVSIIKDVFIIVAERDIYTGDSVEIKIIKKDSITTEIFSLKKD